MKRLWIALSLIVLLGTAAFFHIYRLGHYTTNLERQIQVVQRHLLRDDWENAAPLLMDAYNQWENQAFYLHITLRHGDIDEIRTSFREALSYLDRQEDTAECRSVLERLRNQLELLLEAELPSIKNLL